MDNDQIVETSLRVRYAETDAMGVVYHANYLVWFEAGRGDFFRALNQDYGEWEQRGYFLPVSEACARYHAPARYGDVVTVRTRLQRARSRTLVLAYEVVNAGTGLCLATGWTKHVCVDSEGQVCRLPVAMLTRCEDP